jgi:hypothetical protein
MTKKIFSAAIWAIAPAFFVTTTIIGAVRWFSPVPFWDMWDGTLGFYIERLQGHRWSPFFAQANEHRIVLSKILFWIDYRFFGGLSYFLIVVNIALMFALWLTLCWAARLLLDRRLAYLCGALIGIPCFSWLQAENINWGYQSQFYLAYLLPLLALISMGRWIQEPREHRFVAAVVLGMFSTFAMANGLFALPLLILMLLLSGRGTRWRVGALLLVTALTFAAWAHHYQVAHHPQTPLQCMAEFFLMFLGGTFGLLLRQDYLTILVGVAVICASGYVALRWAVGERDPMFLALVLFIAYVGAAAAAATIGRAYFGPQAALASRYETPVLLLYSALLLLFAHLYRDKTSTGAVVGALSVFTSVLLFAPQMGAFDAAGPTIAQQRMQIALALDLGVKDKAEIAKLYPVESARVDIRSAIQYNLSVFALPSLHNAREAIGKTPAFLGLQPCQSYIDGTDTITTDNRYMSVQGWAFDGNTQTVPPIVFFVANGIVSGAALTGGDRPDVQQTISPRALKAGFSGYALSIDPRKLSIYCRQ